MEGLSSTTHSAGCRCGPGPWQTTQSCSEDLPGRTQARGHSRPGAQRRGRARSHRPGRSRVLGSRSPPPGLPAGGFERSPRVEPRDTGLRPSPLPPPAGLPAGRPRRRTRPGGTVGPRAAPLPEAGGGLRGRRRGQRLAGGARGDSVGSARGALRVSAVPGKRGADVRGLPASCEDGGAAPLPARMSGDVTSGGRGGPAGPGSVGAGGGLTRDGGGGGGGRGR